MSENWMKEYEEKKAMEQFIEEAVAKIEPKPVSRRERYGAEIEQLLVKAEEESKIKKQSEKEKMGELESEKYILNEINTLCAENMRDLLIKIKSRLSVFYQRCKNPELNNKDADLVACDAVVNFVKNFFMRHEDTDAKEMQRLINLVEARDRERISEGKQRYRDLSNEMKGRI